ncbi:MAG: F0F1 ATP synthase subunit A [Candidatus Bipolaricaulota bacterium]|nr:F0F1 ATP synthase subunit A [Candidatus Bipolaricaulota bacterium]MDW8126262.1 F0F1 ATP synthase subunit A [Candidatus Bipolaricaulota bacterium]
MFATVGKDLVFRFRIGPVYVALNPATLGASLGVALILIILGLWLRRGIPDDPEAPPSRRAAFLIAFLDLVENQILGGMGEKMRRSLLPLISTLLLYILVCNLSSIIPVPGMVAPTQDLNVTLGLAIFVYLLTHVYGARSKGIFRHLRGYLEPIPVMLPMNLVGDMGRTLSHGFRLFGNILGGGIMVAVTIPVLVNLLVRFLGALALAAIPLVGGAASFILNAFFGVFAGVIQALVFTLLAAAYIQVAAE